MRDIKVEEVFNPQAMQTAIFSEDESLESIISKFTQDPFTRGIFLVDSEQRFAGVITGADLLKWANLRFGRQPGAGRVSISRRDIYRFVFSTKAREVAHGDWRSMGVKTSDDLETALNQMFEHDELNIPVLDQDGKILGDLRLSEIIQKALEVSKAD